MAENGTKWERSSWVKCRFPYKKQNAAAARVTRRAPWMPQPRNNESGLRQMPQPHDEWKGSLSRRYDTYLNITQDELKKSNRILIVSSD